MGYSDQFFWKEQNQNTNNITSTARTFYVHLSVFIKALPIVEKNNVITAMNIRQTFSMKFLKPQNNWSFISRKEMLYFPKIFQSSFYLNNKFNINITQAKVPVLHLAYGCFSHQHHSKEWPNFTAGITQTEKLKFFMQLRKPDKRIQTDSRNSTTILANHFNSCD